MENILFSKYIDINNKFKSIQVWYAEYYKITTILFNYMLYNV